VLPGQPFDFVGAYARVQHQGAGRQACPVEQLFRGVEKPFCLVQGKGPDAFFPEDGGRNQKGRVSAAPPALQGKIQDAAQDQPPLVPLAGSGKAFAEITLAIFRRDGTDLFSCQFRAFFHHPGSHIADFLQGAGPAVFPCFQAGVDSLGKRHACFPVGKGLSSQPYASFGPGYSVASAAAGVQEVL